jgi:hypothetical protein
MMRSRAAVAAIAWAMTDRSHNQPPMAGVYPNYAAPIVLNGADGVRGMRDATWDMPSSKKALLDGATNRADQLKAKARRDFAELRRWSRTRVRPTCATPPAPTGNPG